MAKSKPVIQFESTFGVYKAKTSDLIGEGAAGRVYAGTDSEGKPVAIKLLAEDRVSSDRRRRFKNEIAFLSRNTHANIVTVIDHGVYQDSSSSRPFYVMERYDFSMRRLMNEGVAPEQILSLFGQLLNGLEAAHLQGVVHRDLKPENVLVRRSANATTLAVADFGIARFTEDLLVTTVETAPAQRMANFAYAAPEQKTLGGSVGPAADLFALGLILNELFTGAVPHGTQYKSVESAAPAFAYLDRLVADLLRQTPTERPSSIQEVKHYLQRWERETIVLQRLSALKDEVVSVGSVDDPLAITPPQLVDATGREERSFSLWIGRCLLSGGRRFLTAAVIVGSGVTGRTPFGLGETRRRQWRQRTWPRRWSNTSRVGSLARQRRFVTFCRSKRGALKSFAGSRLSERKKRKSNDCAC